MRSPGETDSERSPTADDYARRHRPTRAGRRGAEVWLPVGGLLVLGAVTVAAFLLQGPGRTSNGVGSKPLPGTPVSDGATPVSASYEEMLAAAEEAVATDPTDTLALASLAEITLQSHQTERALGLIDAWIALAPQNRDAYQRRVLALGSLQRWGEALEANEALYRLDTASVVTRLNMGSILANLGMTDEARAWWNGVIEAAPGTPHAEAAARSIAQLTGGTG